MKVVLHTQLWSVWFVWSAIWLSNFAVILARPQIPSGIQLQIPDDLFKKFGCLFGCDLNNEAKEVAADSITLQLTDLIMVPTKLDLDQFKQSLNCGDQSNTCGNPNQGHFAVPDPEFDPVIVLFGEDDDNQTAVLVLGDEQDVKNTNDAGIIAQIINSFSSLRPEEKRLEVGNKSEVFTQDDQENIPSYGRDSKAFNEDSDPTHSGEFEYPHPAKGTSVDEEEMLENYEKECSESDEKDNVNENRTSFRSSRVFNDGDIKAGAINVEEEIISNVLQAKITINKDNASLVESLFDGEEKQTVVTDTTNITTSILIMPPFSDDYHNDENHNNDMDDKPETENIYINIYEPDQSETIKGILDNQESKTKKYNNVLGFKEERKEMGKEEMEREKEMRMDSEKDKEKETKTEKENTQGITDRKVKKHENDKKMDTLSKDRNKKHCEIEKNKVSERDTKNEKVTELENDLSEDEGGEIENKKVINEELEKTEYVNVDLNDDEHSDEKQIAVQLFDTKQLEVEKKTKNEKENKQGKTGEKEGKMDIIGKGKNKNKKDWETEKEEANERDKDDIKVTKVENEFSKDEGRKKEIKKGSMEELEEGIYVNADLNDTQIGDINSNSEQNTASNGPGNLAPQITKVKNLKPKPRYINSEQFRPRSLPFNPPKGFTAEEGRRTRKAKKIANSLPWNNNYHYFHSPAGCPASMECVLYENCGPDGFVTKGRNSRPVHSGGRGMLRMCQFSTDGERLDGFCCRTFS